MKLILLALSLIFGVSFARSIKLSFEDFADDFLTYAYMLFVGMYSFVFQKGNVVMGWFGIDFSDHLTDVVIETNVKGFINCIWAVFTAVMIFFGKRICEWVWKKIKHHFK